MMQNHNQQKKNCADQMTLQAWQMLNCGTDADYFNAESAVL